ncbi:MAG: tape measure protein [Flavipsychrobacter sp.]
MADTVEFILKLKDMMSGGLKNVSTTAQSAFNAVDRRLANTQRNLRSTGVSVNDLNTKLDGLKKQRDISINRRDIIAANREIDKLEAKANKIQNLGRRNSGGGMSMAAGIAGFGATALLSTGLAYTANAGLQAGATQVSMEVLAGKQKGAKLYRDLTKFAQESIFGNEVYKTSQTMLAFGVSVDKVMPRMRMLGDISMGNKDRLQSLTLAYAQSQAAGRLMGQDLLQMVNAGFNPLQEISLTTGLSLNVLRKKMEEGAISADMVTKAFEHATGPAGKFFNMTERIGNTPFGKWQALKGQIDGVALSLGSYMAPAIGKLITQYGVPFVNWLGRTVEWLNKNWFWIKEVGGVILGTVVAVKAYTTAQWLMNAAMAANPAYLLAGAIGYLGYKLVTTASDADNLTNALENSINNPQLATSFATAGTTHGNTYADAFAVTAGEKIGRFEKMFTFSQTWKDLWNTVTTGVVSSTDETDRIYGQGKYDPELVNATKKIVDLSKTPGAKFFGGLASSLPKFKRDGAATTSPGGISADDFGGLKDTNNKIASGGPNVITIKQDAMVKDTKIYVNGKEEAVDNISQLAAEALVRTLGSISGNSN